MNKCLELQSTTGLNNFPTYLLNSTNQEKKNYFETYIVEHGLLKESINKAFSYINAHVPERLIFVCGPSGVGKKVLIEGVKNKLMKLNEDSTDKNPGIFPVLSVEAIAPEQGSFNFKNLWRKALITLNEPLLDNKISYREYQTLDSDGQIISLSKIQKADFQEVLQNALKYRNVKAFIIDEAHHMLRVSSGKKSNWSVDLLKSLTNCSKTPVILVGTYELLTFLEDLNTLITDQINQRTRIVNFPRYNSNVSREVKEFGRTAIKLLLNMPFEQTAEKLFDDDWKYFYKHTLGCVGTLKKWFMDAYSLALDTNAKILTKEHLEATKLSGYQCSGMYRSIEDGEQRMRIILSEGDIDIKLGFKKPNEKSYKLNTKKHYTKKPFNRNPVRDIVSR